MFFYFLLTWRLFSTARKYNYQKAILPLGTCHSILIIAIMRNNDVYIVHRYTILFYETGSCCKQLLNTRVGFRKQSARFPTNWWACAKQTRIYSDVISFLLSISIFTALLEYNTLPAAFLPRCLKGCNLITTFLLKRIFPSSYSHNTHEYGSQIIETDYDLCNHLIRRLSTDLLELLLPNQVRNHQKPYPFRTIKATEIIVDSVVEFSELTGEWQSVMLK